jgi:hypothetical protein
MTPELGLKKPTSPAERARPTGIFRCYSHIALFVRPLDEIFDLAAGNNEDTAHSVLAVSILYIEYPEI